MHIEASWSRKDYFALLESPYMFPTDSCSLEFFYHMNGGSIGSLLVYINSGDNVALVKNVTGDDVFKLNKVVNREKMMKVCHSSWARHLARLPEDAGTHSTNLLRMKN